MDYKGDRVRNLVAHGRLFMILETWFYCAGFSVFKPSMKVFSSSEGSMS